jgi:hypothetical protein
MTVAHGFIAIVVYAVIVFLSSSSMSQRAKREGELTVFPISKMVRLLVWSGGLLCAVAAVQDIATGGLRFTGIFLIVASAATVLIPLQSVAISSTAVESLPLLLMKGVSIRWEDVRRVERRSRGGLIVVLGINQSVTHTRFNADPARFEELLRRHVNAHLWK